MQQADKGEAAELDGTDLRVGIVQARFNDAITKTLAKSCIDELVALGVAGKHIRHVTVPGALEVPLALNAMAQSNRFDALVALGCIIRGETYHFELVANESGAGVTRIALDHEIPVANAILTVENEEQAWERAKTDKGDKGGGAVEAVLTVIRQTRAFAKSLES